VLGPAKSLRLQLKGATSMLSFAILEEESESDVDDDDDDDLEVLTTELVVSETQFERERFVEQLLVLEGQPGLLSTDGNNVTSIVVASLQRIVAEIDLILKTIDPKSAG
jgi:hypothetical protein